MSSTGDPINTALANWHLHLRGKLPGGLDALLHEDVVFFPPIVFTPQVGREVTKLYLNAAGQTLGGDDAGGDASTHVSAGDSGESGGFRYVKQVARGNEAILEFETTMGPTKVNGVDIITCDDDGTITEFKVMLRPLQAVNAVHEAMRAMLEKMSASSPP